MAYGRELAYENNRRNENSRGPFLTSLLFIRKNIAIKNCRKILNYRGAFFLCVTFVSYRTIFILFGQEETG